MSETNPILENVDDALDAVEKFIAGKFPPVIANVGLGLVATLRTFLQVPDNYDGDTD